MISIMLNGEEFQRGEIRALAGTVWRSGRPNVHVKSRTVKVEVPSFCLAQDAPYEMEGAMAEREGEGRALAALQDLERIKPQLNLDCVYGRELLYDRRQPLMTCLEPREVEALYLDGAEARSFYGLDAEIEDLDEAAQLRREIVGEVRRRGWDGAIVLPGFTETSKMVLLSRRFLRGALLVRWRGALAGRVPAGLVDFSLGLRSEFPSPDEIGTLPLQRPPRQPVTISWRKDWVSQILQK
jgi:hypothetical protein